MKVSFDLKIDHIMANGDCAVIVYFKAGNNRLVGIHSMCEQLLKAPILGMINVIPANHSLTLVFADNTPDIPYIQHELDQRCLQLGEWAGNSRTHQIPVCYDPQVAPDIIAVSKMLSVAKEQIITWHTQGTYVVAMLGFLPGFAYLNGNHKKLDVPRKTTPALQVAAGSVAIAGKQTGLYALASPGGWQVIGRTHIPFIDWRNVEQPMRLNPLDKVQFEAISLAAFQSALQAP